MNQKAFLEQITNLREQGLSIRAVAAKLRVPKGRVERGLKLTALRRRPGAAGLNRTSTYSQFVGRKREMAELEAALEDALSGRNRLVMLSGEPGIGKTRTAQEIAALAEAQGAQVWWGRCNEDEGTPPYWPWVQPI